MSLVTYVRMGMHTNMRANITLFGTEAAGKRALIARQDEIDGIA
jgi:hypothetical protein